MQTHYGSQERTHSCQHIGVFVNRIESLTRQTYHTGRVHLRIQGQKKSGAFCEGFICVTRMP